MTRRVLSRGAAFIGRGIASRWPIGAAAASSLLPGTAGWRCAALGSLDCPSWHHLPALTVVTHGLSGCPAGAPDVEGKETALPETANDFWVLPVEQGTLCEVWFFQLACH